MKGLVTVASGEVVQMLFTGGELPEVGSYYFLEDATHGTEAQRRTREKLINIYWKSGEHPKYGGCGYELFRDKLKLSLGEGFEKYIYGEIVNGKPFIREVKKKEDIPDSVKNDHDMSDMIMGKLKSCSRYTKKQNQKFIDNLIDDMCANGVDSKEFQEMLKGLER